MDTRNARRELLKQIARYGGGISLVRPGILSPPVGFKSEMVSPVVGPDPISPSLRDDPLLEDLERANFRFFWEQSNPDTGLVRDRFNVRQPAKSELASIAATGFGLTA